VERAKIRKKTRRGTAAVVIATCAAAAALRPASAYGQRALGLDISAWQGNISQTTWNNIHNVENRQFIIFRSSRGGTTGYYDQNDSSNSNGLNTLSQRYDDPYYVQNVNRATAAGLFVGSYHFTRPDIIASTTNSGGIANNGTDEANHFIQMAGAFMRPGYLMPVHDFELGDGVRTDDQMAQFCIDFSNRIYAVMGIRPAIYTNGNYAANILQTASPSLRTQVVADYPQLWSARWPNQADPNSIPVQTGHPKDSYAPIYGPWDDTGITNPWTFWQYASTGRLQSFNNGGSNLDMDVAQGGTEFLKDQLIPAIWMNDNSGQWTTLSNWNSGQTPIAPVTGPGQVAPVGAQTLPTPRLPGAAGTAVTDGLNDTVILDRPNANITVTYASGTTNIRKLYMRETLNITGGSFNINYVPSADSTPISAEFSGPVLLSGSASLSVHTLQVDQPQTFTINGGTLTFNTINLMRGGAAGAKIQLTGDATFAPLNNATATLVNAGSGANAALDLGGGTRTLSVSDGAASIDLDVLVPIQNGTLTKDGPGTMRLNAASSVTGPMTVNRGILLLTAANNVNNAASVVTHMSGSVAGTVQVSNNMSVNVPLSIGGAGVNGSSLTPPGTMGALDNLSGTNTWAGTITLDGTGGNGGDPLLNQISATAGTLVLSGVIQNGAGTSWAKTLDGDVILNGASPNTYTNLTRVFGGRLIIEKDGALGAAGSSTAAAGNTFQLAASNSTIAFAAPPSSPAGFSYNTYEWIHLDGNGNNGLGQLDNLGGNNTFAGFLGLNGPTVSGVANSYLGVSTGSLEITGGIYARGTGAQTRVINKLGAGTLIISGDSNPAPTNTSDGPLAASTFNVNAGTVQLKSPTATSTNLPGVTTWNVGGPGMIQVASGLLQTDTLNVNSQGVVSLLSGGGKTIRAGSINIAADGKVALGDNKLIADYSSGSPLGTWNGSAYTGLTAKIIAGRNGGAWNGFGISTNLSAAQGPSPLTTIAIAEAADALHISGGQSATWQGQSVDATTVLAMYTYAGDADLSGAINGDDYFAIDFGFTSHATGYAHGDFNYDGRINADDYFLIDRNYSRQGAAFSGAATLDAPGIGAVPEPTGIALVTLLAFTACGRSLRRWR